MAEEALSALVDGIMKNFFNQASQEILRCLDLKDEITKLKKTVSAIQAVLLDAEAKQHNSEAIKSWLIRLGADIYDAEDLLDEYLREVRACGKICIDLNRINRVGFRKVLLILDDLPYDWDILQERRRIMISIGNYFPMCRRFMCPDVLDFGQMGVGMKNRMVTPDSEVRTINWGSTGKSCSSFMRSRSVDFGQMEVGMKNQMVTLDLEIGLIGWRNVKVLKNRILEVGRLQKLLTRIEDLPISLLFEILYRLDLKSAMRCKSVARQWCYLISDPSFANDFVRLHASSAVDRPFALLLHYVDKQIKKRHLLATSEEPEFKSLTYIPPILRHDNIEVTVQASCNDLLLCCANMVGNDAGSGPMSVYYVINPISRQWTALPPMPQLARARVGFICWYDTALHKQLSYRVMRIPEFKGESAEFGVEIFSSDTGKWTQSVGLCPQGFQLDVFAFPGVPYKDLLFWWSSTDCLVGFDPYTSKCCQFFEKPVELNPSHGIERLGVCHGTLRICQISGYPYEVADPCLRVWELKDYDEGGKWNLEHELYFDKMVSEKSPWLTEYLSKKYPTVAVLAYHPNDREIVYLMIKFKVVSCNLGRKTLEVVCDIPTADYFYHGCNVFTFVLPCWPTPIPFQTEKAT